MHAGRDSPAHRGLGARGRLWRRGRGGRSPSCSRAAGRTPPRRPPRAARRRGPSGAASRGRRSGRPRAASRPCSAGRPRRSGPREDRRSRRFGLRNVNGVPTTFRVLGARLGADCRPAWYRVQLPIRPNGARGWIPASAVRRYVVDYRIVVDLSDRVVTVFQAGQRVRSHGAPRSDGPTPRPRRAASTSTSGCCRADPSGPFGPGGIGISAFSPVLTGWAQGGPIAIHGTNQPASIGLRRLERVPADRERRPRAADPRDPRRHTRQHPRLKQGGRHGMTAPWRRRARPRPRPPTRT